jgi:glutathione S-transferase
MFSFAALPAFQPLVLFTVLLILKMGAVAFVTANERRKARVVVNPEDTGVNPGSHAESDEAPNTLRAKRAHLNDVENIPVFLVLALIFTLAGCSATAGWAYFGVYFVARTLHTIFYLKAVQPWRTAAFFVGQLTQLGIIVQLLAKVL